MHRGHTERALRVAILCVFGDHTKVGLNYSPQQRRAHWVHVSLQGQSSLDWATKAMRLASMLRGRRVEHAYSVRLRFRTHAESCAHAPAFQ